MKSRIFYWSITSALAGFLFGFDTVVISGAEHISPDRVFPVRICPHQADRV